MGITYADIARDSGVSTATVSLILRNPEHPEFNAGTRQRVLEAARRLNYMPNRVAASLRGGKTRTLALVVPYNEVELMDVAERTASELGFSIMIQFTHKPDLNLERKAVCSAIEHRVDGLIWQPSQPTRAYASLLPHLAGFQRNVVFLEHRLRRLPDADWVYCDIRPGMEASVSLLRERGYRRFAYLCPADFHVTRRWRMCLFRQLLGQPFELLTYPRDESPRQLIRDQLHRLLRQSDEPLGIVSDLDWAAVHAIDACRSLGVGVPEQVGVIGINDSLVGGSFRIGEATCPRITAVRRPVGEAARTAVRQLIARINGSRRRSGKTHPIQTTLVERESTRPSTSPAPTCACGGSRSSTGARSSLDDTSQTLI